jgi:hypothetical protein
MGSAIRPRDSKSISLVRDDWMVKMATETQSVIAMESHGEIGRGPRKFMEQGYHIAIANSVAIRLYPQLPDIVDAHTSVRFTSPLNDIPGNPWTSFLRYGSWQQKNSNSNLAKVPARSSTREHSLAEPPLVTRASLSELDDNKIVHDLKRWHDINFDPDLHFRSNLDCGKGFCVVGPDVTAKPRTPETSHSGDLSAFPG